MVPLPCWLLGAIFLPMCIVIHAKTSSGSGRVGVEDPPKAINFKATDVLKKSVENTSRYTGSKTNLTTSGGQGSWEDISQAGDRKRNSISPDESRVADDNVNEIPGLHKPGPSGSTSYGTINNDEQRLLRDNPSLASQSSRSAGPTFSSDTAGDTDRSNVVPVPQDDQGLETMVCPTVTQTLYLRPKTSTRTVHFIRQTASAAQANNYDYVTVGSPSQADRDGATASVSGSGLSDIMPREGSPPPPPPPPALARIPACPRQTTEFRSFVYVSTVFVPTTLTDYTTITRTLSIPVENTYQQEPVTRFKTVFVNEVQPSMQQHRRPANIARYPDSQQPGMITTVFATVTVTQLQPQDCPEVTCGSGSQPARNYVLNDDYLPAQNSNTESLDAYMYRTAPNSKKQPAAQTMYLQQNGYVVPKQRDTVYALSPSSQIRPTPVKRCRPVVEQPAPLIITQTLSSAGKNTYEDDYANMPSASTKEEVILERYKRTLRDNHNRAYVKDDGTPLDPSAPPLPQEKYWANPAPLPAPPGSQSKTLKRGSPAVIQDIIAESWSTKAPQSFYRDVVVDDFVDDGTGTLVEWVTC